MTEKKLTTFTLALSNLKSRANRTVGLIVLVTLLAAVLFGGMMLVSSIQHGMNSMSGRFGADMMVVPRGSDASAEGLLLRSEPSAFYLDEDITAEIAAMPGVKTASPQLFIQSLDAACCTVPVQLIGYDPATDFNIQPWIIGKMERPLEAGEVVIGDLILAEPGDEVIFFNQPFKVVAKMDATGMGFDSSVFMTMDTAQHMIELSRESGLLPGDVGGADVSSVMVKLDDGTDPAPVRTAIINAHLNTDVVTSSDMLIDISSRLSNMTLLIYMLAALIFVLCIVVLVIMFSVTINERRSEFALFRAQGATRKKIIGLVMTEAVLISLVGAACGILLASLIYFPFTTYIGDMLGMPFLMPTTAEIIGYGVLSAAVSVLTGPLACLPPARKIGQADTYTVMREN